MAGKLPHNAVDLRFLRELLLLCVPSDVLLDCLSVADLAFSNIRHCFLTLKLFLRALSLGEPVFDPVLVTCDLSLLVRFVQMA